jgi:hypothetical protein
VNTINIYFLNILKKSQWFYLIIKQKLNKTKITYKMENK